MSRNLMGLFQRPFMDWDGAPPLSALFALFALFHSVPDGAFYGLITTLAPLKIDRSRRRNATFDASRPFSR